MPKLLDRFLLKKAQPNESPGNSITLLLLRLIDSSRDRVVIQANTLLSPICTSHKLIEAVERALTRRVSFAVLLDPQLVPKSRNLMRLLKHSTRVSSNPVYQSFVLVDDRRVYYESAPSLGAKPRVHSFTQHAPETSLALLSLFNQAMDNAIPYQEWTLREDSKSRTSSEKTATDR